MINIVKNNLENITKPHQNEKNNMREYMRETIKIKIIAFKKFIISFKK